MAFFDLNSSYVTTLLALSISDGNLSNCLFPLNLSSSILSTVSISFQFVSLLDQHLIWICTDMGRISALFAIANYLMLQVTSL